MTSDVSGEPIPAARPRSATRRDILLLTLLCIACVAPFLNKPFHIQPNRHRYIPSICFEKVEADVIIVN